jgi:hypothetical protein
VEEIDGRPAPAIEPGVIGNEADTCALEPLELLTDEIVDAETDARDARSLIGGLQGRGRLNRKQAA